MLNQNSLTTHERNALTQVIAGLYAEIGFSDVSTDEVKIDGLSRQGVGGVLSSLEQKRFIWMDDSSGLGTFVYLTKAAYKFHPEWSVESGIEYEALAAQS